MNIAAIAGILLAAGTANAVGDAPSDDRPVTLETEQHGDSLRVTVIGNSARAVTARYRLEADSGQSPRSNRSAQSGTATLRPDQRTTLISLNLGKVSNAWTVRLIVTLDAGQGYEIEKHGGLL
jgi:hypothetical protein